MSAVSRQGVHAWLTLRHLIPDTTIPTMFKRPLPIWSSDCQTSSNGCDRVDPCCAPAALTVLLLWLDLCPARSPPHWTVCCPSQTGLQRARVSSTAYVPLTGRTRYYHSLDLKEAVTGPMNGTFIISPLSLDFDLT